LRTYGGLSVNTVNVGARGQESKFLDEFRRSSGGQDIALKDAKTSTYKLALLRLLCRIA